VILSMGKDLRGRGGGGVVEGGGGGCRKKRARLISI
jgi:hypothetical protein